MHPAILLTDLCAWGHLCRPADRTWFASCLASELAGPLCTAVCSAVCGCHRLSSWHPILLQQMYTLPMLPRMMHLSGLAPQGKAGHGAKLQLSPLQ